MRGVGVTKFVALFLVLGLLSGCAAFHTPDYVLPSRDGLQAGEEITVGKSENVYGIARKHNVPMREMIVLNNLKPPFILKEGQTLVLPLKEGENSPLPKAAPLTAIEAVPLDAPQSLPPPDKAKDDGTVTFADGSTANLARLYEKDCPPASRAFSIFMNISGWTLTSSSGSAQPIRRLRPPSTMLKGSYRTWMITCG